MTWYLEEVMGVEGVIAIVNRLLPRLDAFQCIRVRLDNRVRFILFEKPWPAANYLISGKLLPAEVAQLLNVSQKQRLLAYGDVISEDGSRGLSFSASEQSCDASENCRQFLEIIGGKSSKCTVEGISGIVHTIPSEFEQF